MNDNEFVYVPFDTLLKLQTDAFAAMGVPEADAKICAEVLFEADKKGIDSHGVGRLYMYYIRIKRNQQLPTTEITVEKEMPGIARLNAHNGMGMPVSHKAMQMAIDKAKNVGIGMVTVGESNHYGIAGYYALMAANQGCIGICGTNARPSIAPTNAVEPVLGTNPLTIALPSDWDFPWFADHATSITQRGKIELYARINKPLQAGWVINDLGENPTDANAVLDAMLDKKAALNPLGGSGEELGGYKGYNYATLVEILSAALSSANFCQQTLGFHMEGDKKVDDPYRLGHFFIAINVEAFMPLEDFKKKVGDILRENAAAKKMPQAKKIWVAGEKEYEIEKAREKSGVPIAIDTQLQLQEMIADLGLKEEDYNIEWTEKYTGKSRSLGW